MSEIITQRDLEQHYQRVQDSNDRVVSVLKEVAVQFNTIANQLMLMAKSNEDIILMDKENHNSLITYAEKESSNLVKSLTANCESCIAYIEETGARLDKITSAIAASTEKSNSGMLALSKQLTDYNNNKIKSSTIWLLVIGSITGSIALMTAVLKLLTIGK